MSIRSRYCRRWAFAASFSILAAGCAEGRPELTPGDLRDLRVVAVRSDPADPEPGKPVALRALVMNPKPSPVAMVWAALDPSAVLPSEGAERGEVDPGSIGFSGAVTPPIILPRPVTSSYPLLVTGTFLPAVTYTAGVTSVAIVVLARAGEVDVGRALDEDTRTGYLRELLADAFPAVKILRIGDPVTNANPDIRRVRPKRKVIELEEGTRKPKKAVPLDVWSIARNGTIEMEAIVEDESPDCETGEAKEYGKRGQSCVSYSWYASNGKMNGFVRKVETWTAPPVHGIYTLAVVARDRIGGLDWWLQDVNVGRPVAPGKAGRALLRSDTTEPDVTKASRLLWLPVADDTQFKALSGYRAGGEAFAARVEISAAQKPEERLPIVVDASSFEILPDVTKGISVQGAAEKGLTGLQEVMFKVEIVEPSSSP